MEHEHTQLAAGPPADAQFHEFACAVGGGDESLEKRGGVGGVVPGESEGLVRERKGKVDPVEPAKVDVLWGKRGRGPVGVVSHYERGRR